MIDKTISKRITTKEDFVKRVNELTGNEYSVMGAYLGTHKKILMRHNKCKNEWPVRPSSFLYGSRCPKCIIKPDKFLKKLPPDFILESEYHGSRNDITLKHIVCQKSFTKNAGSFIHNPKCPYCTEALRLSIKRIGFLTKLNAQYPKEYTLLGEFKGNSKNVTLRHICGEEYTERADLILNGKTCPCCKKKKQK